MYTDREVVAKPRFQKGRIFRLKSLKVFADKIISFLVFHGVSLTVICVRRKQLLFIRKPYLYQESS